MSGSQPSGLVIGIYTDFQLSCNISESSGISVAVSIDIVNQFKAHGLKGKVNDSFVYLQFSVSGQVNSLIAVVGFGDKSCSANEASENVRSAIGTGVRCLEERKVSDIKVDVSINPRAAAEGAFLGSYKFDSLCTEKALSLTITPFRLDSNAPVSHPEFKEWNEGKICAESQNFVRDLTTTPANLMTPTIFAESVVKELESIKNVTVNVYDQDWIETNKMGLFLSVAQGSAQPPKFVEIIYNGLGSSSLAPSVALVGKGITFDSGGVSIKPSKGMDLMKGDMGGGASVVGAMRGIALLKAPINAVCVVPLSENMINGRATKPGDVFTAMNGKTVEILNTDAEGRLVLADALTYVIDTYKPKTVIDVATLTGAMVVSLSEVFSGVFTDSDELWNSINDAGNSTGDLVWRMPLHPYYLKNMESRIADIANITTSGFGGGSSAAAMFLSEFLGTTNKQDSEKEPKFKWAHMDIAGSSETSSNSGHQVRGMSGRPTRTLIEFLESVSSTPL
ncbi:Cytosol aminopeptidase [Smittium mucronatum]|uniref:Cytosol aminopeptidase n=1 Tax=Smittium mucronatum TaxID=133383 RepID=A0A1R0H5S7_9FUNG|nr:Cytosol aminopeptidase [Smittium mucronatum]